MFVRDNLQKLKVFSGESFPNTKFLLMFIGGVICPFVLLAVGGRTPDALWQFGLAWSLLTFATILLISAGGGLMMFRSKAYAGKPPSISPNYN